MSWSPPDPESYAYLLGLYLGDGCVVRHARTTRLVIMLDGAYPRIVDAAADAVRAARIGRPVSVLAVKNSRAVAVQSYSSVWPDVFPQAGPGRKHERLFCEYCERLGVRWTQSNHRNISVSHRRSVAILDEFIGPKT